MPVTVTAGSLANLLRGDSGRMSAALSALQRPRPREALTFCRCMSTYGKRLPADMRSCAGCVAKRRPRPACPLLAASVATPLCQPRKSRDFTPQEANDDAPVPVLHSVWHGRARGERLPDASEGTPPQASPDLSALRSLRGPAAPYPRQLMYRILSFSCARMTGLRRLAHPAYPPCALWSQAAPRGVVLPRTNCASSVDFECGDFKPCLQHGVIGCPTHTSVFR